MTPPTQRCALINGRVFTGEEFLDRHAVLLDGSHIAALVPQDALATAAADMARLDLGGHLLAPGFIDLQVNGGGGVLFNDIPEPATLRRIAAAHRRFGTTGFLATVLTDSRARRAQAVAAVRAALEEGVPGLLGVHLEGPHLNPARRGIHDPGPMGPPEPDDLALMTALGPGRTLVTLAPEVVPADTIRALAAQGVRVSIGHTAAGYAEIRAALAAGATGFTHLFNAMTPFGSREPGAVGAALDDPGSWCGVIADLHHVHPASLRVAWRAKAPRRLMLVTDAMPPVGTDADRFTLYGRPITVREGRCVDAEGTLAGSVLDMASAVRNTVHAVGLPLAEALRMAATYPAEFMGLERTRGRIAPGYRADLVLLDAELRVRATWIGGAPAWSAGAEQAGRPA